MIVTKLKGGLGNQIFQWAYAKNISLLYNIPLYLDIDFYDKNITGITKRTYSLNSFPKLNTNFINDIKNNGKKFITFNEPNAYSKISYNDSYNYYFDGYFQSEKYFLESSFVIKNELAPTDVFLKRIKNTPLIESNTISLHVRRTDYVTSNGYHPIQSIEYYKNALDIIGKYEYLFIFSDDINWCKENLKFDNMIFIEGNDDVEDIWLMSMCKHNIIANSTFSWWGAWLNSNPNKKVIAPTNWFGINTNINTNDLVPDGWIKI